MYHFTDDRKTTMQINACIKILTRKRPIYTPCKLRRRTNRNEKRFTVYVYYNNGGATRIFTQARRRSCMRKRNDTTPLHTSNTDVRNYTLYWDSVTVANDENTEVFFYTIRARVKRNEVKTPKLNFYKKNCYRKNHSTV